MCRSKSVFSGVCKLNWQDLNNIPSSCSYAKSLFLVTFLSFSPFMWRHSLNFQCSFYVHKSQVLRPLDTNCSMNLTIDAMTCISLYISKQHLAGVCDSE